MHSKHYFGVWEPYFIVWDGQNTPDPLRIGFRIIPPFPYRLSLVNWKDLEADVLFSWELTPTTLPPIKLDFISLF